MSLFVKQCQTSLFKISLRLHLITVSLVCYFKWCLACPLGCRMCADTYIVWVAVNTCSCINNRNYLWACFITLCLHRMPARLLTPTYASNVLVLFKRPVSFRNKAGRKTNCTYLSFSKMFVCVAWFCSLLMKAACVAKLVGTLASPYR